MNYILAILAGLIYGGLAGYLKYLFLWRKVIKDESASITQSQIYTKMIISNLANVVVLLIVFLLRDTIPLDFVWVLLAAAVALSLTGKLAPMKTIVEHVKEGAS